MKTERVEKKRLNNIALVFDKLDKNQSLNFYEKGKSRRQSMYAIR